MTGEILPEQPREYLHKHRPKRRSAQQRRHDPQRQYVRSGCTCGWVGPESPDRPYTRRQVAAAWNEHLDEALAVLRVAS